MNSSAAVSSPEQVLKLLSQMLLIRTFEEQAAKLYAEGEIKGSIHLAIGQEAVAVGVCAALEPGDWITSTHRGHHHSLARGARPELMMAELLGRHTGYCGGRGGSMHLADPAAGILGANGIVAANIPIAAGAAYSAQVLGEGQVSICFFGEGASGEGAFHEGLNLARVWELPIVFVCENNLYAEMMPASLHMPTPDVAARASAYDFPGKVVDGNDLAAVYSVTAEAVSRARGGGGPTLIEAKTYRWRGHYEGDAQGYRTKDEIDTWRKKDPVERSRREAMKSELLDEQSWELMVEEAKRIVDEAIEFARESPWPNPDDLMAHLYADS